MIHDPTIVEPRKAANILAAEIARLRGVFSESVPMAAEAKPEKTMRATRCDSRKLIALLLPARRDVERIEGHEDVQQTGDFCERAAVLEGVPGDEAWILAEA